MTDTTLLKTDLAATLTRPSLRLALGADAVVTGVNGAAYLAAAGPLSDLLGLDAGLLRGIGGFLLAFAIVVALVARSPRPFAVKEVVAVNVLWAAGSIVVAVTGAGDPTTAGTVWIAMQAVVVGLFAELQLGALRRERR